MLSAYVASVASGILCGFFYAFFFKKANEALFFGGVNAGDRDIGPGRRVLFSLLFFVGRYLFLAVILFFLVYILDVRPLFFLVAFLGCFLGAMLLRKG